MKRRKRPGAYNLRKILAWDRAFFTEEELSMLSGSIGNSCMEVLPTIHEEGRTLSGSDMVFQDDALPDGTELVYLILIEVFTVSTFVSSIPSGTWYCKYYENMFQKEKFVEHNANAVAAGRITGIDPLEQITKRCIRIVETIETDVGGCALCTLLINIDITGDTFPLGCAFDKSIVHHKYFEYNLDSKNSTYSTKKGIYSEGCGLDNVMISWGHDDYMYLVAKENGMTLPPATLFIIRYHSFYPLHKSGAYTHLMNEDDVENLKWLKIFKYILKLNLTKLRHKLTATAASSAFGEPNPYTTDGDEVRPQRRQQGEAKRRRQQGETTATEDDPN
ncbi:hypothetical protein HYC85_021962 [Camellia sinensis]|uniref:Inositol oxygenase n=1 Tax=Camellia sinensis TaxID=4442 RepID=A0A7J7GKN1_CAMSI|nr:hypothetical protein HYC85_021962 [Camellia sinensis]